MTNWEAMIPLPKSAWEVSDSDEPWMHTGRVMIIRKSWDHLLANSSSWRESCYYGNLAITALTKSVCQICIFLLLTRTSS